MLKEFREFKIISQLKEFYDVEAEKFSSTRKKKWPEFEYILKEIKSFSKNTVKILELGCGDGRLYGYLAKTLDKSFKYIGVDISENLINIAKGKYNGDENATFFVDEMFNFLKKEKQQIYDFVILVSSFQHIPTEEMRLSVLKGIYKVLIYGGKLIMSNWSFSRWFLHRYRKNIIKSFIKNMFTFEKLKWNDVNIPWKSNKGLIFHRYYHIFTLTELDSLLKMSGFIVEKKFFIDKFGNNVLDWKDARNTFIVGKKDVLYN